MGGGLGGGFPRPGTRSNLTLESIGPIHRGYCKSGSITGFSNSCNFVEFYGSWDPPNLSIGPTLLYSKKLAEERLNKRSRRSGVAC